MLLETGDRQNEQSIKNHRAFWSHRLAVGISKEIVSVAEKGIYAPDTSQFVGSSIFERLTEDEMVEMFDWEEDEAKVKLWLREGITWQPGNAADPELTNILGPQDMVVASNFLCHMAPADAEKCLGNIAQLVSPGGYLFVSGVDLDVRTKVAIDLGWEPVPELIAEIHNGDPSVRADWPWQWWGLEPSKPKKARLANPLCGGVPDCQAATPVI